MRLIVFFYSLCAISGEGIHGSDQLISGDFRMRAILEGEDVSISQYAFVGSIRRWSLHRCGASIINRSWALTAAHCFYGEDFEDFTLRTGSSNRLSGGEYYDLEKIVIHKDFNHEALDSDIALVKVSSPILMGENTAPIPLPPYSLRFEEGAMAAVMGWGYLAESGPLSVNLKRVYLPIMNWTRCKETYSDYRNVTETMICAGLEAGGPDACHSDSGGPLVLGNAIVGIVSWGRGCGRPGSPGVYVNVHHFLPWIRQQSFL